MKPDRLLFHFFFFGGGGGAGAQLLAIFIAFPFTVSSGPYLSTSLFKLKKNDLKDSVHTFDPSKNEKTF